MIIPSRLPQFEKEKILIIVTGFQTADFYLAADGEMNPVRGREGPQRASASYGMNKIGSIRIPRRKYSDEEGFSVQKSGVSGSAREYPKEAILEEFLNLLETELKKISKKVSFSSICLFSPDYAMNEIKSAFPTTLKNKIKFSIKGNFSHYSQTQLLEKINLKRKKII